MEKWKEITGHCKRSIDCLQFVMLFSQPQPDILCNGICNGQLETSCGSNGEEITNSIGVSRVECWN